MGQALYRKYRSKSFGDVVGQKHITDTLEKAIKSGRISHAYLFTGPRGVGKTSVARILAHEVNGLDYNDDSMHLDIIEIDAASNRRIDEIRELRDKVHISPTSAKYKVYIIDEVHMLTREAFNALLKTLEEPPAHVIFILATTEAHKLPETIISRTQRFEFKPISTNEAVDHLKHIAKAEKIKAEDEALELLALHGDGSFRDSIGLFDQLSSGGGEIKAADVRDFLGLPSTQAIKALAEAVEAGNMAEALDQLDNLKEQGADTGISARMLARNLRQKLMAAPSSWIPPLLKELIEVPASSRPDERLEIAVLAACSANHKPEVAAAAPAPKPAQPIVSQPARVAEPVKKVEAPATPEPKPVPKTAIANFDEASWDDIVQKVKDEAASLYTALRLATPEYGAGKLTLAFQFPLHQKKVDQAKHKELIGKIVAEVTGQNVAIDTVVDKTKKPKEETKPKEAKKPAELETISNIFGQPEVLES